MLGSADRKVVVACVLLCAFHPQPRAQDGVIEVEGAPPAESTQREEKPVELDRVTVTGSRIERTDFETAQPVYVMSRDEIERTGLTSIGDILQNLSVSGSTLNSTHSVNTLDGQPTLFNLRNLGEQRVLVLVNGRRWAGSLSPITSSTVDLNTIPVSAIERVEILKDGAAPIYGSDAVAGVVNLITRRNYQATDVSAQVGGYLDYSDGANGSASLSTGLTGRTSFSIDLDHTWQHGFKAGDRDLTASPRYGTGNTRGLPYTPQGDFYFFPDPSKVTLPCAQQGVCDLTLSTGGSGAQQSDFRDFVVPDDLYNWTAKTDLQTPARRDALYTTVRHQFDGNLSLGGELLYQHRWSHQVAVGDNWLGLGDLSGSTFYGGAPLYISADNPYNPFHQDIGRGDPSRPVDVDGDGNVDGYVGSGVVLRSLNEFYPWAETNRTDTLRIAGVVEGVTDFLGRSLSWNFSAAWNRITNAQDWTGFWNLEKLQLGLGPPADCTAAPGCVPINLFGGQGIDGRGSLTREMLDYINLPLHNTGARYSQDYQLSFSQDVWNLPAGELKAAYGLEYRRDNFSYVQDPNWILNGFNLPPTQGTESVKEAFLEFSVPLLAELPAVRTLEVSLAGRYSDYGDYDPVTTGKVGLRWKPLDNLLLRGTWSQAFRAPSTGDRYFGQTVGLGQVVDPCSGWPENPDEAVRANCQVDGVPESYQQANSTVSVGFGGNPQLKPERAQVYTAGVVFTPRWVDGLDLYLDWYRLDLRNTITVLDLGTIFDQCYGSAARSDTCTLIRRDPSTGDIAIVNQYPLNLGATRTSGVDFSFNWTLPWRALGVFRWTGDLDYLIGYSDFVPNGSGSQRIDHQGRYEFYYAYPRVRANTGVAWSLANWNASWNVRYLHHQVENCDDGGSPSLSDLGLCSDPDSPRGPQNDMAARWYHDVRVGYRIASLDLRIDLGVNNLFGQDPPVATSAFIFNYDNSTYEIPGRMGYVKLSKRF